MILDAARKGFAVDRGPDHVQRAGPPARAKKPTTFRYAWGFSEAIVKTWLR